MTYTPCVGSGYCCKKARCVLGALRHGPGDNCPSLAWEDGRYWCQIIKEADGEALDLLKADLAIGAGCCSPLFNQDRLIVLSGKKPQ